MGVYVLTAKSKRKTYRKSILDKAIYKTTDYKNLEELMEAKRNRKI